MADKQYLIDETINIAVAINGKVRDQISLSGEDLKLKNKEEIVKMAKATEKIKQWTKNKNTENPLEYWEKSNLFSNKIYRY